jgi:hypothetical protein
MTGRYATASTLLVVLLTCILVQYVNTSLTVELSRKRYVENGYTLVTYCVDCPSPHSEGALARGLHPKHGLQEFHVIGTLVYCVPNSAEGRKVLNAHHFKNRIVLIDRGALGILDKVEKILDSETVGVIIADDGRCKEDLSYCGLQAGSIKDGGFAINDDISRWRDVPIPVVLISVRTADLLRSTMGIRKVYIPKHGMQNITVFHHGKDQYKDEL